MPAEFRRRAISQNEEDKPALALLHSSFRRVEFSHSGFSHDTRGKKQDWPLGTKHDCDLASGS